MKNWTNCWISFINFIIIYNKILVSQLCFLLIWWRTFFFYFDHMGFTINLNFQQSFDAETHCWVFMLSFSSNIGHIDVWPLLQNERSCVGIRNCSFFNNKILFCTIFWSVVLHITPKLVLIAQYFHQLDILFFWTDMRVYIEPLHQEVSFQRQQIFTKRRLSYTLKFCYIMYIVDKRFDYFMQLLIFQKRV